MQDDGKPIHPEVPMPAVFRPVRTVTATCALAGVGLGLTGCQSGDSTPASPTISSNETASGQSVSGQASDGQVLGTLHPE